MPNDREAIYEATAKRNPQEAVDLKKLHEDQDKEREHYSSYSLHILVMDAEALKHSGHASVEAALLYNAKSHRDKMNKLVRLHIKKYPD